MNDYKFIFQRFGIFLTVYIGLSLLFSIAALNKVHLGLYHTIGTPFLNLIHTGDYIDMNHYEGEPMNKWDSSFFVYTADRYAQNVFKKAYRKTVRPGQILHKGLREMVLLPSLLLLALFIATPIAWKKKLLYITLGLFLLYLIAAMHISYNIKLSQMQGVFSPSSLIDYIIIPFGAAFTDEHFNIIALLIWAFFSLLAGAHKKLLA